MAQALPIDGGQDAVEVNGYEVGPGAYLAWARLERSDLGGVDLSRADLTGASLQGTNLRDANLRGANLSQATLTGADLAGADLREVLLEGTTLDEADLTGADLRGVDLTEASCRGVTVGGARVGGTRLRVESASAWAGTDLSGVVWVDTADGLASPGEAGAGSAFVGTDAAMRVADDVLTPDLLQPPPAPRPQIGVGTGCLLYGVLMFVALGFMVNVLGVEETDPGSWQHIAALYFVFGVPVSGVALLSPRLASWFPSLADPDVQSSVAPAIAGCLVPIAIVAVIVGVVILAFLAIPILGVLFIVGFGWALIFGAIARRL